MLVYRALSRIFPRSFAAKVLAVAFLGIHVPVFAILVSALIQAESMQLYLPVLIAGGVAMIIGTAASFLALYAILAPLYRVEEAMRRFEEADEIIPLPEHYRDEVGRLMARGARLIRRLSERLDRSREAAETDPLTGIPNRRGFVTLMAGIDPSRGALLAIDVDQFKDVNDRLGHAEGDRVLVGVAEALRSVLRRDDVLCRFGGDEFLVFLPGVTAADGEIAGERLRLAVETQMAGYGRNVTISIGLLMPGGTATLAERITGADHNLYAAKAAGRNCVIWSGAPVAA